MMSKEPPKDPFFNKEVAYAYLTQACISHSYRVESIKEILTLWKALRKGVVLKDDMDVFCALLACGRIMDIKEDIRTPAPINSIISRIREYAEQQDYQITPNSREFIHARLTSVIVENTEKTETITEIMDIWNDARNIITIRDNFDILLALLTEGRILELKVEVPNALEAKKIFVQIQKEFMDMKGKIPVGLPEYGAGIITAAFIEITPKLEKIRDIISTWDWVTKNVKIRDRSEFLSSILAAGRIKDLDAKHLLIQQSIHDIIFRMDEEVSLNIPDD